MMSNHMHMHITSYTGAVSPAHAGEGPGLVYGQEVADELASMKVFIVGMIYIYVDMCCYFFLCC